MSSKRKIVIFSLDNTLRDAAWRFKDIPYGVRAKNPLEWLKFHAQGLHDEPIKSMMTLFKMYAHNNDYDVYIWANSVEECRDSVRKWLNKQGVLTREVKQLFLRPDGCLLKNKEVYERWLQGMPAEEAARVDMVVSNDDALCELFTERHVDVLKLNDTDVQ